MIDPWIALLLLKMAIAAVIVVGCSLLAERSGPVLAALIATLPISVGPVYVFLALDHDPAFITAGALGSMAANLANVGLAAAYIPLAQRFGVIASLLPAVAAWLVTLLLLREVALPVAGLAVVNVIGFRAVSWFFRRERMVRLTTAPGRRWYAVPLRALSVALIAGMVTGLSARVGPGWSGVLAAFPVVSTSLIAVLHPAIGGKATAALIANAAHGLLGLGLALGFLHLAAEPLGTWPALALALLICLAWNTGLMLVARRARRGVI